MQTYERYQRERALANKLDSLIESLQLTVNKAFKLNEGSEPDVDRERR
jgi:hypothetical protein